MARPTRKERRLDDRGRSEQGIGPRGPSCGACPYSAFGVIDLTVNRVRVTPMPTASSRAERSPDREESARFLALADQDPGRLRPHVLLTSGGHPASLELIRRARARGIAVALHLHNFGFDDQWATEHARTPAVENRKPDQTARSPSPPDPVRARTSLAGTEYDIRGTLKPPR
jgi:hypothetical protein